MSYCTHAQEYHNILNIDRIGRTEQRCFKPFIFANRMSIYNNYLQFKIINRIVVIELSHWYKVDKVFYTLEPKLRCVKVTSYITKRS